MNQSKLWVSMLSVLVIGALLVFVVSRAAHDRVNHSYGVPTQQATKFPINVKGLAIPTSTNYVYRVVGPPGTTARISYVDQDGSDGNVTHAVLPWSISTVTSDGAGLPAGDGQPAYVQANTDAKAPNARVTCQAFADGKLVDQETATGSYAIVSCGFPY
jgi:hypothetical protein